MTSGWQGAPDFRRYGRELVSKPAISLRKKSWAGYTVERLYTDVIIPVYTHMMYYVLTYVRAPCVVCVVCLRMAW